MSENQRIACGERISDTIGSRYERHGLLGRSFAMNKVGGVTVGVSLSRILERMQERDKLAGRRTLKALYRSKAFSLQRALPWSTGNWQSLDLKYLDYLPYEEEPEEEVNTTSGWTGQNPSVAGWAQKSSPWFSRPHVPARVSKTPSSNRSASAQRVFSRRQAGENRPDADHGSVAGRQSTTVSAGKSSENHRTPSRRREPVRGRSQLQRAGLRLHHAQLRQESQASPINELPPYVARSSRLLKALLPSAEKKKVGGPLRRIIAERQNRTKENSALAPLDIAKGRFPQKRAVARGLRPTLRSSPSMQQVLPEAALMEKPVVEQSGAKPSPWFTSRQQTPYPRKTATVSRTSGTTASNMRQSRPSSTNGQQITKSRPLGNVVRNEKTTIDKDIASRALNSPNTIRKPEERLARQSRSEQSQVRPFSTSRESVPSLASGSQISPLKDPSFVTKPSLDQLFREEKVLQSNVQDLLHNIPEELLFEQKVRPSAHALLRSATSLGVDDSLLPAVTPFSQYVRSTSQDPLFSRIQSRSREDSSIESFQPLLSASEPVAKDRFTTRKMASTTPNLTTVSPDSPAAEEVVTDDANPLQQKASPWLSHKTPALPGRQSTSSSRRNPNREVLHRSSPVIHAAARNTLLSAPTNTLLPTVAPRTTKMPTAFRSTDTQTRSAGEPSVTTLQPRVRISAVEDKVLGRARTEIPTVNRLNPMSSVVDTKRGQSKQTRLYGPSQVDLTTDSAGEDSTIAQVAPQKSPWYTRPVSQVESGKDIGLQRSQSALPQATASTLSGKAVQTEAQRSTVTGSRSRNVDALSSVQHAASRKVVARSVNPSRPVISSVTGGTSALQRMATEAVSNRLNENPRQGRFARVFSPTRQSSQQLPAGRLTQRSDSDSFYSGLRNRLTGRQGAGSGNSVVDVRYRSLSPVGYARTSPQVLVMPFEGALIPEDTKSDVSTTSPWYTRPEESNQTTTTQSAPTVSRTENSQAAVDNSSFEPSQVDYSQEPLESISAIWGGKPSAMEHMMARFDFPVNEQAWSKIGTEGGSLFSSPKVRRLLSKPNYQLSSLQQFLNLNQDSGAEQPSAEAQKPSPWFTRSSPLTNLSKSQQRALQKMGKRVYRHPNGMFLDPKIVAQAGFSVSNNRVRSRLPLPWTLEAVDLKSSNDLLPNWAKRASEKPMINGSSDFLKQLVRASSMEEVVRVVFERSEKAAPASRRLPPVATQVIEQIRKEAHKVEAKKLQPRDVAMSRLGPTGKPRRRTAQIVRGFTGLKPLATAQVEEQQAKDDKVVKLAKRLEELVLLAESQGKKEAQMGVRMAEDSTDAIAEGRAAPKGEQSIASEDANLEALYRDVLHAVENMTMMRKMLRLDNPDQFDGGW